LVKSTIANPLEKIYPTPITSDHVQRIAGIVKNELPITQTTIVFAKTYIKMCGSKESKNIVHPCPEKKSDIAIHGLSCSGEVIAAWLRLQ